MRLISARIRGYGRLVDTKLNLDSKVIAIVGPNEAGKTTLLKALAHIDSDQAVPGPQRSRAVNVKDTQTIVSLEYVLDETDRTAVADLDLQEPPQTMTVGRRAMGGSVTIGITPSPRKSLSPLRAAAKPLRGSLNAKGLGNWIDQESEYGNLESGSARDFKSELSALIDQIESVLSDPNADDEGILDNASSLLAGILEDSRSQRLRDGLDGVITWFRKEDPDAKTQKVLWSRTPDLMLFDEADRTIASVYTLDDALINDIPDALVNLTGMANLELKTLLSYIQSGDIARRDTAITQANRRLDQIFADAWKQAWLSVRFSIDGSLLRITIWEDGDNITVFDERSAGLRMFVALIAFLKVHASERPPILLIDEAENHLHIDAQADLVNMFIAQQQAIKVIYTTHSPACLPPDLGSGIRSVVPRPENQQISDVKNSFWEGTAGYTPLMLAMGAAAAAFTPARFVVLAEGATEMILLPTLIRNATGETSLPYQIAPGLSEVPKDFYPKLDLEGAKVVFLLDSDEGGNDLEKGLTKSGVSKDLIVRLGALEIENILAPLSYVEAVRSLLPECNRGVDIPELPMLEVADDESWSKRILKWIQDNNLKAPSKVAVANWLIENQSAVPTNLGAKHLRTLHKNLVKALGC